MNVILLVDVKGSGKKGDIVDVSTGYARNFLIPRKLAAPATPTALGELQNAKASQLRREEQEKDQATARATILEGKEIKFNVKAGKGGRLFGSITAKEIAHQIKILFDIEIDKKKIELKGDIKAAGHYGCHIRLYPGVGADISLIVEGENA